MPTMQTKSDNTTNQNVCWRREVTNSLQKLGAVPLVDPRWDVATKATDEPMLLGFDWQKRVTFSSVFDQNYPQGVSKNWFFALRPRLNCK